MAKLDFNKSPYFDDIYYVGEIKEVPKKLTDNILKNKSIVTPDQA